MSVWPALIGILLFVGSGQSADQRVLAERGVADERLDRLEQWVKAVARHEPGLVDDAATMVGSWPARDVRVLWVDATALAGLIRDPRRTIFSVKIDTQHTSRIRYSA